MVSATRTDNDEKLTFISGGDISQVVGAGPFSIEPSQEITIAFALHGSSTFEGLVNSAEHADSVYNLRLNIPRPVVENKTICAGNDVFIAPTGGSSFKWYTEEFGGDLISSESSIVMPAVMRDTLLYVSSAAPTAESFRTPVVITVRPSPEIIASGPTEFCEGGSVLLSAAGEATGYTWSNGSTLQSVEANTSGSYFVTADDPDFPCASFPVDVLVHPLPKAAISTSAVMPTDGPVDFLNESIGATSWTWDFDDGETSMEQTPSHTFAEPGNYTVTLKAVSPFGCEAAESIMIGIITGLEKSLSGKIQMYPNPVQDETFFIHFDEETQAKITVVTSTGDIVFAHALQVNQEMPVPLPDFPNGIYFVKVSTPGGTVVNKVIVSR